MSEFDRVAFVWGENVSGVEPLRANNSVTVALWSTVLNCASLRWNGTPPDLDSYDVFLVNLFHTADSTHIEQIRRIRPDAKIVAMPDPSLDIVLLNPEYLPMFQQMALADVIGGRTQYDCYVYGALLNKPTFYLPSPIGPTEYFAQFRDVVKGDWVLSLDHPMQPYSSAQNVAALSLIQRQFGLKVVYSAARDVTKEYARLAGLEAEWHGHIPFVDFVEMTARARVCVDLYSRHSHHRQAMLCAAVGTPLIGSCWTNDAGQDKLDPFRPQDVLRKVEQLLTTPAWYEATRRTGFMKIDEEYSFEASCARVRELMGKLL